ncbi:hypothetical protein QYE76_052244 [Lolium multiflorum]|uniref:DUF6598 domain-containing protein n=1 Tax=Lolium multiflorum TaxID=4521 RepID=A0AAD8SUC8_LOLMU|nr:hypothetical protein QYE76_052244 [Lolium multiflorum]
MEADGEAVGGAEPAKHRSTEGNSACKIDDESATTEEFLEEKNISEDEEDNWADIDREVSMGKVLTEDEEMDNDSELHAHYTQSHPTSTASALQLYSIKVEETKLVWPLHVYGMVAARDPVDRNRNILFNRKRDNCQILTEDDPYLLLTGPSRAIVFLDPVDFEIDLKVKGGVEDKERLIHQVYTFNGTTGPDGPRCSNDNCTVYLHFQEIVETVQATVTSVQIIRGSWPSGLAGKVVCRDVSSHEEVLLLDFPDGSNPPVVDRDGNLDLSRRVVSVDVHKDMLVCVKAYPVCGGLKQTVGSGDVMFTPQRCGITEGICDLGVNCQVEFRIAWSLLVVANWLLPS